MKKRDFLAGMCCGIFITRAGELNLSNVYQIITVALVILALNLFWEWIKNATTKNASRNMVIRRLPPHKFVNC